MVQLFPEVELIIPKAATNLRRLTMNTERTSVETRIRFMALCIFYHRSLQAWDIPKSYRFHRGTRRNVIYHELRSWSYGWSRQSTLVILYLVHNSNLSRLIFESSANVDLYLQNILHQTFPNVTHLRLHNCVSHRLRINTLNASGWDLQVLELDITNMRGQALMIQVNTITTQRANFQFDGVGYIRVGSNEAFVPRLVITAGGLQHLRLYTAGLDQVINYLINLLYTFRI